MIYTSYNRGCCNHLCIALVLDHQINSALPKHKSMTVWKVYFCVRVWVMLTKRGRKAVHTAKLWSLKSFGKSRKITFAEEYFALPCSFARPEPLMSHCRHHAYNNLVPMDIQTSYQSKNHSRVFCSPAICQGFHLGCGSSCIILHHYNSVTVFKYPLQCLPGI